MIYEQLKQPKVCSSINYLSVSLQRRSELTGGLGSRQRLTLLTVADGEHVNHVLGLRRQSGHDEVVPGWWEALLLGPPTTGLLVADLEAADGGYRGQPVDREGVGPDVGELQFGR